MNQRVSTITALRTWLETAEPDDRAAVSREGVATLLGDWDELTAERDRLRAALARIENINNGPDQASGEWRCLEAAAIARAALAPTPPPAR